MSSLSLALLAPYSLLRSLTLSHSHCRLGKKVMRGKMVREAYPSAQMKAHRAHGAGESAAQGAVGNAAVSSSGAAQGAFSAQDNTQQESLSQKQIAEALAVLLEADTEWGKVGETWQRQVDNYGLLQLDITWCLLNLVMFQHAYVPLSPGVS